MGFRNPGIQYPEETLIILEAFYFSEFQDTIKQNFDGSPIV